MMAITSMSTISVKEILGQIILKALASSVPRFDYDYVPVCNQHMPLFKFEGNE